MRAVVVEDQPLLRDVLVEALTHRGVDVVGSAGDRPGALADPEIPAIARRLGLVAAPAQAVVAAEHDS